MFQVENRLFRVHRYFLTRDSPVFSDILSISPPEGSTTPEGTSDANPVILQQVKSIDFERLLDVIYKPYVYQYD